MRGRILSVVVAVACVIGVAPSPGRAGAAPTGRPRVEVPAEVAAEFEQAPLATYIVTLRGRADLSHATAITDRDARRIAVVDALRSHADASQAGLIALLEQGRNRGTVDSFTPFWITNAVAVRSSRAFLDLVATLPEVEAITPNRKVSIVRSTPRQIESAVQAQVATYPWNIEKVNAPGAWATGITGSSVVIANLDTGVDRAHPSVSAKYRGIDGNHDYDWWDAVSGGPAPYDDNDHGTHTMGTILGGDGPGPDPNDIGVAYDARWIAAKAFDQYGGGTFESVIEAGQYLAAPTRVDGTGARPDMAPDVISNSWGGGSCDNFYEEIVANWRALDIFPAFAIGNSGSSAGSANSPGDYPDSYSAGATDQNDAIAYFSSRGPSCYGETKPEVSAPGVSVRSSVAGGGFAEFSGTSMATPHVAAAAALVIEAGAGAVDVSDAESTLTETARDLGATGADNTFGAGLIQIDDAVISALQGGTVTGTVTDSGGDPIAGARVTLEGTGLATRRTITDGAGLYRVRALAGSYDATVSAFGYIAETTPVTVTEGTTVTADASLALAPQVTLSGTVRETPADTPLEYVEVTVKDTPLAPVHTNAAGEYAFVLPTGTYEVSAHLDGCREDGLATIALNTDATHDFDLARLIDASGYVCDRVPFTDERGSTKVPLSGYYYSKRAQITLPFTFDYFGEQYTSAWVNSNGFLAFEKNPLDVEKPDWVNRGIPDAARPNVAIYALWDFLNVRGSERGIYTATFGDAPNRRFVVEYRNFEVQATGDLVNFSIVLFENGTVETRYRSLEGVGNGQYATVGIEGPGGRHGLEYSRDENLLDDASALRYFASADVGIVTGQVTEAAEGHPLADIEVSGGGLTTASGVSGRYQLALAPGTHDVSVAVPAGYDAAGASVTVAAGDTVTADFALAGPRAVLSPESLAFDAELGVQAAPVTLANTGSKPLDYEVEASGSISAGDADDDSGGIVEVEDASAVAAAGNVAFRTNFSDATPMNELYGRFLIDSDRNEATGDSEYWWEGKDTQHLGVDYVAYFSTFYELVWVYHTDSYNRVGTFPLEIDGSSVAFDVALSVLGNDEGDLNYAMSVGDLNDYWDPQDYAPDVGHGTTAGEWLDVDLASGTLEPGGVLPATLTVDPEGVRAGTNHGLVIVRSNDALSPELIEVTLTSPEDTEPPEVAWTTTDGSVVGNNNVSGVETLPPMNGTAVDLGSGIYRVVVKFVPVLSTGTSPFERVATLACNGAGTSCTWKSTSPIGQYRVTPVATDGIGKVTAGPTITITAV